MIICISIFMLPEPPCFRLKDRRFSSATSGMASHFILSVPKRCAESAWRLRLLRINMRRQNCLDIALELAESSAQRSIDGSQCINMHMTRLALDSRRSAKAPLLSLGGCRTHSRKQIDLLHKEESDEDGVVGLFIELFRRGVIDEPL